MSSKPPILPGATLGILGGGQLGRMFTIAARTMGYRVMVLDPDAASPAGQMADTHLQADYADHEALKRLGEACAAVTTEFENVPAASLIELANHCRVSPGAAAVAIVQDRSHEKSWLAQNGFATAPFALVYSEGDLDAGMADVGAPALLKVARFGYDGKGQARVNTREEARAAFREFDGQPCVLEGFVKLECEVSVVLARSDTGECALFPVAENRHENGILDVSIVPARVPQSLAHQACEMARDVANKLGYRRQIGGPHCNTLLAHPNIKLHLYGKQTARPGRKMGHFNVLDADPDAALRLAEQMRHAL